MTASASRGSRGRSSARPATSGSRVERDKGFPRDVADDLDHAVADGAARRRGARRPRTVAPRARELADRLAGRAASRSSSRCAVGSSSSRTGVRRAERPGQAEPLTLTERQADAVAADARCPDRRAGRPAPRRNPLGGRRRRGRRGDRTARGSRGPCRESGPAAAAARRPGSTTAAGRGRRRRRRRSGRGPRSARVRPRMTCSAVDLPAPLGPVSTVTAARVDVGRQPVRRVAVAAGAR